MTRVIRDETADTTGPRIDALRVALAAGSVNALADFWRDVEAVGTPLIDPIPGDDTHYLVTFLYREGVPREERPDHVVLCSHAVGWSFLRNRMEHLAGTDLWCRTYRLPAGARASYWLSPNDSLVYLLDMDDRAERMATWKADRLARCNFVFPKDDEIPGDEDFVCSMFEMPDARMPEWSRERSDVPAGQLEIHRVHSALLGNERRVWVYTPPGYDPNHQPYDLLVLFDGYAYLRAIPTPSILDNLLAAGQLPPFVLLLVDNRDRDLELPCHAPFADFLAGELLPWARERYTITSDPAHAVVAGSSYGGLAAAYAGFRHPEVFGAVLSQSGAFWWRPEDYAEHEWLIHQFAAAPRLPLQFYLDAGTFENGFKDPSMLVANRHLRDVLQAKGYPLSYAEYIGGHDYPWWEITLPDGLLALTARRPSPAAS
jgi:enterochelin esterase-like enzyme